MMAHTDAGYEHRLIESYPVIHFMTLDGKLVKSKSYPCERYIDIFDDFI